VYLPFSAYIFKSVMAYQDQLLAEYSISFVLKEDFQDLVLVKATRDVGPQALGGKPTSDAEALYSTTDLSKVRQQADGKITEQALMDYFSKLKNAADVRLVKLVKLTRQSETEKKKGEVNFGE
jgi:hypothetical protein